MFHQKIIAHVATAIVFVCFVLWATPAMADWTHPLSCY